MTEFTAHFRLPVPDFNQEPWHDQFRDLCVAIDDMAFNALLGNASVWTNSTPYAIGDIVLDNANALLYVCAVAHVSPATPTTFLAFRTANPTFWNQVAQVPQQRGTWTTATTYIVGDFVIDNSRYAVCIVSHVSGVSFNADLGAGKWSVLIDLSGLNVGINGLTEAAISAAPTVNLAAVTTSQVLVTGSGQTITSFGTGAELFKIIRFDGINSIAYNSPFIELLEGKVRQVQPGDVMFLRSNNLGNWKELYYFALASEDNGGIMEFADASQVTLGSSTTRALSVARGHQLFNERFEPYFPSGTRLVMQQTTPPPGWTKDLTHNDKAMRVVSGAAGSGGVSAFSTIFGKTQTDNFTLTLTETPGHSHSGTSGGQSQSHKHFLFSPDDEGTGHLAGATRYPSRQHPDGGNPAGYAITYSADTPSDTGISADANQDHTHTIPSEGSGGPHLHGMDIRVQFVDTIIAVRN